MLGADGLPIPEFFVSDGLHMTAAGYVIWDEIMMPVLMPDHMRMHMRMMGEMPMHGQGSAGP